MLKDGMTRAQIVAALQGYAYDIDRIVALIPFGNGAKEAQSRLKQLKTATHGDYKHRHSIASSTQLTPQEQANLERSIRDMFSAIQAIGVNTNPGPEWRSALFQADLEIERCLAKLQDPVKTRVESVEDWL
jgi:hypothetical protein